jgi:hypothetical protein
MARGRVFDTVLLLLAASERAGSCLEAHGASRRDQDLLLLIVDGLPVVVAGLEGLEHDGVGRLDVAKDPERGGVALHADVHGLVQFLLQLRELHNAR